MRVATVNVVYRLKDIIKNTGLLLVPPLEVCHFDTGHNKVTKVTRCHTRVKPPRQLAQPLPAASTVVAKAFHSQVTTGQGDMWTVTDADRQVSNTTLGSTITQVSVTC